MIFLTPYGYIGRYDKALKRRVSNRKVFTFRSCNLHNDDEFYGQFFGGYSLTGFCIYLYTLLAVE